MVCGETLQTYQNVMVSPLGVKERMSGQSAYHWCMVFHYWRRLLVKNEVEEELTYGTNEIGCNTVEGHKEWVMGGKKAGPQYQQHDGDCENITIIVTVCADSTSTLPAVIFKGKGFQIKWKQDNPANTSWGLQIMYINKILTWVLASAIWRRGGLFTWPGWKISIRTPWRKPMDVSGSSSLMDITPIILGSSSSMPTQIKSLSSAIQHIQHIFSRDSMLSFLLLWSSI